MPESVLIFAAFSAYTAVLVALGYVAGRLRAEYRVMRMLARRSVETRIEHAREQEANLAALTDILQTATTEVKAQRKAIERERAEMVKAKGFVA